MKRLLFSIFILMFFFVLGIRTTDAAKKEYIDIYLEGVPVEFYNGVYVEENRTLVEFRALFEALGLTVSYDAKTKTVKGMKTGGSIELKVGSKRAVVNGSVQTLDVAATIINDRLYVPLRFVSENAGLTVKYIQDGYSKEIYLLRNDIPKTNLSFNLGGHKAVVSVPNELLRSFSYETSNFIEDGRVIYSVDFFYPDARFFKDDVWLMELVKVSERDWRDYWSQSFMIKVGSTSDGWVYAINQPGENPYLFGDFPPGSDAGYFDTFYKLRGAITATIR